MASAWRPERSVLGARRPQVRVAGTQLTVQLTAAEGDLRLAGHLAELAVQAAPDDAGAHRVRAEVFAERAGQELSTMSKGVFSWAADESQVRLGQLGD